MSFKIREIFLPYIMMVIFSSTVMLWAQTFLKVGDTAPDFTLEDFKGETFVLSEELKNEKGVILWFTNLCAGCKAKFPKMEELKNYYQGKGIEIIAISQLGEDKKTVEDSIRKNKLTLRFLYDSIGKVTELFSGKYVPGVCPIQNIYIIQKDAKIAYTNRYPGVEESAIIEQLDKIRGE